MLNLFQSLLKTKPPFADQVYGYAHFEQGYVITKTGSIVALFRFKGLDLESASADFYQYFPNIISSLIKVLPKGATVQKYDCYSPHSHKPISQTKDFSDENSFAFLENYFDGRICLNHHSYIAITFPNENRAANPMTSNFAQAGLGIQVKNLYAGLAQRMEKADGVLDQIEQLFDRSNQIGIKRVMDKTDFQGILNALLNFRFPDQKSDYIEVENDTNHQGRYLYRGDQIISYVSMTGQGNAITHSGNNEFGVPTSFTYPIQLGLPFPHYTITTFKKLDVEEKLKSFDREKFFNLSFRKSDAEGGSEDKDVRFADIKKATLYLRENQLSLVDMALTVGVVSYDQQQHQKRLKKASNAIQQLSDASASIETVDNINIHSCLMPGFGQHQYRTMTMSCEVAASYFNTDRPFTGTGNPDDLLFCNRRLEPVYVNFSAGNSKHAIVVGPTGSGKSFFTGDLIVQRHTHGWKQLIIDVGGSFQFLVEELGGLHINYNPQNPIRLNPFITSINEATGKYELTPSDKGYLVNFLALMYQPNKELSVVENSVLSELLDVWYAQLKEKQVPTIAKFYAFLNTYIPKRVKEDSLFAKKMAAMDEVAFFSALEMYAIGSYKNLFNFEEVEDFAQEDLLSFDLDLVKNEACYPLIFSGISRIVERVIEQNGGSIPLGLYMDECWVLLEREKDFIEYIVRTGRKNNISFIVITQSVIELENSEVGKILRANIPTKVLLDHREVASQFTALQDFFALSDSDMIKLKSLIKSKKPAYRELLMVKGTKSQILACQVSPELYCLFTTDPEEKRLRADLTGQFKNKRTLYKLMAERLFNPQKIAV